MTKKHLLWWVFRWLAVRHPAVLNEMIAECDGSFGDGASSTVNRAMSEAHLRDLALLRFLQLLPHP